MVHIGAAPHFDLVQGIELLAELAFLLSPTALSAQQDARCPPLALRACRVVKTLSRVRS